MHRFLFEYRRRIYLRLSFILPLPLSFKFRARRTRIMNVRDEKSLRAQMLTSTTAMIWAEVRS